VVVLSPPVLLFRNSVALDPPPLMTPLRFSSVPVVALAVFPECTGNEIACTVEKLKAKEGEKSTGQLYDKVFLRHWDTWADGTRNHLFFLSLPDASAKPVALTDGLDGDVPSKPFGGNEDFVISADSRTVYYAARVAGMMEPWSTNFDLFRTNGLTGSGFINLTDDNDAWD
jgi:acylaminoacyl-peptidase